MSRIAAVIFDLDDTLYDCAGQLADAARRRAAKAMVEAGLPCSEEEAYRLQIDLTAKLGVRVNIFEHIAEQYKKGKELARAAYTAYNRSDVGEIKPFPDVIPTLRSLRAAGFKLFILTTGVFTRQKRKIDVLGLAPYVDDCLIEDDELGRPREAAFLELLHRHALISKEVAVVGDRPHDEIRTANYLGMTTIQMLHGRFQSIIPQDEIEEADYRIAAIGEVPALLKRVNRARSHEQPRIVAIGGGTGLPIVLQGLKRFTKNLTAVVTVTDSGRSSGKLRKELHVLPPGDIRNCLVALSDSEQSEKRLHDLFQYRFSNGSLEGMSLGNLFLVALTDILGSFEQAVKEAGEIFSIRGKVLPSTLTDTHVCATLADGTLVEEEFNVRQPGKPPIKRVFLKPESVPATPEALDEIKEADIIVLGPGSLFTSVVTNLLVQGIPEAIAESDAKVIYVCNIVNQPGQSDGFNASDHVHAIMEYLTPARLDTVFVNTTMPSPATIKNYEAHGKKLVEVDKAMDKLGVKVVRADLCEKIEKRPILWEKADLLRHDPNKLAALIMKEL